MYRAYARISDKHRQKDGASLATQVAAMEAFANSERETVGKLYQDMESGTKPDRSGYTQLLAEVERGDTVLAWKMDRGGRNAEEMLRFRRLLEERGARLVFVTEPEAADPLMFGLKAVLAEQFSRDLRAKVIPNMRRRVEIEGRWMSRAPMGYKLPKPHELDYNGGKLVMLPDARATFAPLWAIFLATGNATLAATSVGVIPETAFTMLHNRAYCGDTVWADIERRDTHEPLVSRATWDAAHALLVRRSGDLRRQRFDTALLTGFLYLEETSARLYQQMPRTRNQQRYYVTQSSFRTPYASVRADYAEAEVLDALRSLSFTPVQRRAYEKQIERERRTDPQATERERVTRDLAAVREARVNAADDYSRRRLDDATYDALKRRHDATEAELRTLAARLPPLPDAATLAPLLDLRTRLDETVDTLVAHGDTATLRGVIEVLFMRIEVWDARPNGLRGGARAKAQAATPPRIVCYRTT